MKMSYWVKLLVIVSLGFTLLACQLAEESDNNNVLVENDETKLADRVHVTNETIAIEEDTASKGISFKSGQELKAKDKGINLTLVAEVDPLEHEGTKLQATEIRIKGNKAYVSYNVAGETFLGGVEVFDISDTDEPSLISSVVFTDTDINGLAIHGSDLYLAAATSDESYSSPAILRTIKLKGGKLSSDIENKDIASFAATDVEIFGSDVYVTSGADDGYVTVLDKKKLTKKISHSVIDARSVDSDNGDIAVLAGTNGVDGESAKLITFDKKDGEIQDEFELSGATIKHSKSTVEVKKDKAVLAMGDGGVQLVCLATGEVLKTIDLPVVEDMSADLAVANAATAYKRSVFMANGEVGVYVAVDNENIDSKGCDTSTLELVGKLQLNSFLADDDGNQQSINHIVYRNDILFVAAGLGGLKILKVDDTEGEDDDDDSDDDKDDDDDDDKKGKKNK